MTGPIGASRESKRQKQKAERYGRAAESLAAVLLRLKRYRLIARDLRTPVGEIDLIAQRGNLVAFVEVKARTGEATEVLSAGQRRRIVRAAELFLASRPDLARMDVRFDLIIIGGRRWPRHIQAAFRADD
ncbi:MAG: YraN family protein [Rhodospirillales bacterium]|nr:YraN family protein [Rhodospirillales bacterium]